MDNLNKTSGKVQKLPAETIIVEGQRSGALTENAEKDVAVSHVETTGDMMSDRGIFKVEKVFIKDFVEGGAGNTIQMGTKLQLKPSLDDMGCIVCPSAGAQAGSNLDQVAAGTASMETAVDKGRDISQWQHPDTAGLDEVSSGFFANEVSVSEDRIYPSNSANIFPTPASSRESILSESSDKEKSWSAVPLSSVTSPASFSRTVSPCSSVLSGIFTPTVLQFKKHFLAPGSSLIHTPQTCFSSCESLFSSVCPQSPPPRHRHRPPLTRLSLLTAILRKGRLPVLSPALQRPYTPCWPVNPVTLSFCNACSAASSVASIPLEFSSTFSSSVSIDSQSQIHREPNRCVTSPPPVHFNERNRAWPQTQVQKRSEQICSGSLPQWGQVISPPRVKRSIITRAPLPVFCSNFDSISPSKHEEIDCSSPQKLQHSHISISKTPELHRSNTHTHVTPENNLNNHKSPSSKPIYEPETRASLKQSQMPNSSLSKLQSLSQQLRSSSLCRPQLQPSRPLSVTHSASPPPPPPIQQNTGRCETGRSCPVPHNSSTSESFYKDSCLSPSQCTPIAYPAWPSPTSPPPPTPSPAPPNRDLIPSPSLSLCSSPSPRPGSGISDCTDREGKKRKSHKIKLSYKSLAAIPTNSLLLDQQAIDEQVERGGNLDVGSTPGGYAVDTHAEMCSPAQLRQQSEELYAVIDEILTNSLPTSLHSSRSSTPNTSLQINSFHKSLGRETKYASLCSLYPSTGMERNLTESTKTKPGVIRPMTAIPTLMVEDKEECHPNPGWRYEVKETFTDKKKMETGKDFYTSSKPQILREEERKPGGKSLFSQCDLQITESDERFTHPVKAVPTSFRPTEEQTEFFQTHI
ncbi:muscular LMNA-interacting protein isoform X2 [Antennarius striatus]|uniref:muscular LMNA-interacting protein isoform X2 n=1 Tax=Antennarius striatus TaxID=241820 RepID=UPI0035B2C0D8